MISVAVVLLFAGLGIYLYRKHQSRKKQGPRGSASRIGRRDDKKDLVE